MRVDARRATCARREQADASPIRLALPVLFAVVGIGAAALISSRIGLSLTAVPGITLAVAATGAVIAHRPVRNSSPGSPCWSCGRSRPASGYDWRRRPAKNTSSRDRPRRPGQHDAVNGTGLLVVPNSRMLRGLPETIMQA